MTKHIIVGYDGTQSSFEAVQWAAAEATAWAVPLRIVSCYDLPIAGDVRVGGFRAEAYATLLADVESRLRAIKQSVFRQWPDLEVSSLASAGPASTVLIAEADHDDLVVVGASSHRGATALWLGTTPRTIARHARCPVVVVRVVSTHSGPTRVVVGVDGSPASDQALSWAGTEADRHGVPLVIVHGWHYPYIVTETSTAQARDLTRVDAACVLDRAVELARERVATEVTGVLVEASPATALLDTVTEADMLVVGSSGCGALRARLFGSTVDSLIEHAANPLVIVRPEELLS